MGANDTQTTLKCNKKSYDALGPIYGNVDSKHGDINYIASCLLLCSINLYSSCDDALYFLI